MGIFECKQIHPLFTRNTVSPRLMVKSLKLTTSLHSNLSTIVLVELTWTLSFSYHTKEKENEGERNFLLSYF